MEIDIFEKANEQISMKGMNYKIKMEFYIQ